MIEYCGRCDKKIIDLKSVIFGIVKFQTYDEPSEQGFICKTCQDKEQSFEIAVCDNYSDDIFGG